jgi:uncharacterized protein
MNTNIDDILKDILKDIACADAIPVEALRKLVPHGDLLLAHLAPLARQRLAEGWLYPAQDTLLFYGLFALAAARHHAAWPLWSDMLPQSETFLHGLFGDGTVQSVTSITLGLMQAENIDTLAALASKPDISEDVRIALAQCLTRLMCDELLPRQRLIDLIDRWFGSTEFGHPWHRLWCAHQAIIDGGITERRALLEEIYAHADFGGWRENDRAEDEACMAAAINDPADMTRFDNDGTMAPSDPVAALGWLQVIEAHEKPSRHKPLVWREREWLAAILNGTDSKPAAMCFEELDGFFHALVIGPDLVLPSDYLPIILGEDFAYSTLEQTQQVMGLLQRHWNSIVERTSPGHQPSLWLEDHDNEPPGRLWASGFLTGVALREAYWLTLDEDSDAAMALDDIAQLSQTSFIGAARYDLLADLTDHILCIAEHWRAARKPARLPEKSMKIGRNAPCPCGSGKKWKKCCGAAAAETLH